MRFPKKKQKKIHKKSTSVHIALIADFDFPFEICKQYATEIDMLGI